MDTRKMLSLLAATALLALPGCATDDAAEKDAKEAQPTVEKAAQDAEKAPEDAADEVDDNDSK
jgi:outer membrane biogenesis lipoprotein LolB